MSRRRAFPEPWPTWVLAALFVGGVASMGAALAVGDERLFVGLAAALGGLGWLLVLVGRRRDGQ